MKQLQKWNEDFELYDSKLPIEPFHKYDFYYD